MRLKLQERKTISLTEAKRQGLRNYIYFSLDRNLRVVCIGATDCGECPFNVYVVDVQVLPCKRCHLPYLYEAYVNKYPDLLHSWCTYEKEELTGYDKRIPAVTKYRHKTLQKEYSYTNDNGKVITKANWYLKRRKPLEECTAEELQARITELKKTQK